MTPARPTSWWLSIAATTALVGCSAQAPWSKAPSEAEQGKIIAQVSMARLSERHGQPEFAERIYQQVLVRHPDNLQAVHRLAVVAAKRGHYGESQRLFERALKLGPPSAELLSDYGYCLYLQDDLSQAERVLRDALGRDPQYTAARNNLALTLGEQERFEESLAEFRKAVGEAEAHANLGFVQSQLGYYEQAEASLHRALNLNPDLKPAAEALIQLAQAQGKMPTQARPIPTRVRHAIAREDASDPQPADTVRLTSHETADPSRRDRSNQVTVARLPRVTFSEKSPGVKTPSVKTRAKTVSNPPSRTFAPPWREATKRRDVPRQQAPEQQKTAPPQAQLSRAAKKSSRSEPPAAQHPDRNTAGGRFRPSRRPDRSGMVSSGKTGAAGPRPAQAPYPWQRPTWQAGDQPGQ